MSDLLRRRRPELVAVLALAIVVAIDCWWLARFRHDYLLDIDEAGYLANAYDISDALRAGSITDLWSSFQDQTPRESAPLVPLLTGPAHLLLGQGILRSFVVQIASLVLIAACAWGIGRRFAPPAWAALTVLVVLGVPELIDYSRHYHFAITSAAALSAACYALMRSERLERRGWAIAWGAAMGLAALARTLVAAFLPGLVLAGALAVWWSPDRRRERLVNFGLGVGLGIAVAALWWLANWRDVLDYLGGAGFGDALRENRPAGEGGGAGLRPLLLLLVEARHIFNVLYGPLALAVGAALVVGGAAWWRRRRARGDRFAEFARSDAAVLAVTAASGVAVLFVTRTSATGSALPLVLLLVMLAVAAIARLPQGWPRRALAASLAALATVNVISKSDAIQPLSGTTTFEPPRVNEYVIFDGRGLIQRYVEDAGYPSPPASERMETFHREWLPEAARLARWASDFAAAREQVPVVLTGELDLMFNNNTVLLGAELEGRDEFFTSRLFATRPDDTVEAYRRQLELDLGVNFLVLYEPPPFRIGRPVSPRKAAAAARSMGFRRVRAFELPDGRRGTVLWRDSA